MVSPEYYTYLIEVFNLDEWYYYDWMTSTGCPINLQHAYIKSGDNWEIVDDGWILFRNIRTKRLATEILEYAINNEILFV